jgi:hypothetical protein
MRRAFLFVLVAAGVVFAQEAPFGGGGTSDPGDAVAELSEADISFAAPGDASFHCKKCHANCKTARCRKWCHTKWCTHTVAKRPVSKPTVKKPKVVKVASKPPPKRSKAWKCAHCKQTCGALKHHGDHAKVVAQAVHDVHKTPSARRLLHAPVNNVAQATVNVWKKGSGKTKTPTMAVKAGCVQACIKANCPQKHPPIKIVKVFQKKVIKVIHKHKIVKVIHHTPRPVVVVHEKLPLLHHSTDLVSHDMLAKLHTAEMRANGLMKIAQHSSNAVDVDKAMEAVSEVEQLRAKDMVLFKQRAKQHGQNVLNLQRLVTPTPNYGSGLHYASGTGGTPKAKPTAKPKPVAKSNPAKKPPSKKKPLSSNAKLVAKVAALSKVARQMKKKGAKTGVPVHIARANAFVAASQSKEAQYKGMAKEHALHLAHHAKVQASIDATWVKRQLAPTASKHHTNMPASVGPEHLRLPKRAKVSRAMERVQEVREKHSAYIMAKLTSTAAKIKKHVVSAESSARTAKENHEKLWATQLQRTAYTSGRARKTYSSSYASARMHKQLKFNHAKMKAEEKVQKYKVSKQAALIVRKHLGKLKKQEAKNSSKNKIAKEKSKEKVSKSKAKVKKALKKAKGKAKLQKASKSKGSKGKVKAAQTVAKAKAKGKAKADKAKQKAKKAARAAKRSMSAVSAAKELDFKQTKQVRKARSAKKQAVAAYHKQQGPSPGLNTALSTSKRISQHQHSKGKAKRPSVHMKTADWSWM